MKNTLTVALVLPLLLLLAATELLSGRFRRNKGVDWLRFVEPSRAKIPSDPAISP